MPELPAPYELGLPEKYVDWRENQEDAILQIIHTEKPFHISIAPTGFGKSMMYVSAAYLSSKRFCALTSTKGLQTQLMRDFESIGLVDIRGRNAYECRVEHDGSRCDHGPCIAGYQCPMKGGGCYYFDAYRRALNARMVVTNYAYWMSSYAYGEGLGRFDMLTCDEAHNLPNVVSDFLTITLDRTDTFTDSLLPSNSANMQPSAWAQWARSVQPNVDSEVGSLKTDVKRGGGGRNVRRHLARMLMLQRTIDVLATIDDTWIIDYSKHSISFSPVWPKKYTDKVLFLNIPKIVLTSATVCEKTSEMVGIESDEKEIIEYPHSFPAKNRLLIHVPTVRMNHRIDEMDIRKWYSRIDQILRGRQDRKGIIHTVSYERSRLIMAKSKFKEHMITHKTGDAIQQVNKFKRSLPPKYLVSPSVTTGYDFPDDECRFQVIGKIAYPDSRNKITKARIKEDDEYGAYVAMMELVQECGRPVRSATDWSENLIIDDNIKWFIPRYGKFAPKWFLEAVRWHHSIPRPPELRRFMR